MSVSGEEGYQINYIPGFQVCAFLASSAFVLALALIGCAVDAIAGLQACRLNITCFRFERQISPKPHTYTPNPRSRGMGSWAGFTDTTRMLKGDLRSPVAYGLGYIRHSDPFSTTTFKP